MTKEKQSVNTEKEQKKTDGRGKNLPQHFKPGQSGNPKGRPKGSKNFTTLIRETLQKMGKIKIDGVEQELSYEEAMAFKMIQAAVATGDFQTQKLIWNYLDGMPKQTIETKGDETEKDREKLRDIHRILTHGKDEQEKPSS